MVPLLVAAVVVAAPVELSAEISARERPDQAVLLILTPKQTTPNIPSSAYLNAAQRVFGRETSLSLASAEQAGIEAGLMRECPVEFRISCWARMARPGAAQSSRYLLVLNLQRAGSSDRASLIFLDLDEAGTVLADPSDEADAEAKEQRIFELALTPEPSVLSPEEDGAVDRFWEDLVLRDLRTRLERSSHFRPYGEIELIAEASDLMIDLDGRVIGTTRGGAMTVREILPGERTIAVRRADGWSSSHRVTITRGGSVRVETEPPPSAVHPARAVVWVSGFVLAAAGATVLGITAANASDGLGAACLQRSSGDLACPSAGTLTSAYAGVDAAPTTDPNVVNPSGLLMAPLGLGLAAGGLAAALGTLLVGDDSDFPWPQVLVGLGTAGLVYGVGVALDAR